MTSLKFPQSHGSLFDISRVFQFLTNDVGSGPGSQAHSSSSLLLGKGRGRNQSRNLMHGTALAKQEAAGGVSLTTGTGAYIVG